jgi:antitoxin CcdA
MAARASKPRRATNVSLPAHLIEEARRLGINISQACEQGLEAQVRQSLRDAWLEENLPALEAWNEWVRENGVPYAEYRRY